jgi:virginiamycin A acetyltransferase
MSFKDLMKSLAGAVATLLVLPAIASFSLRKQFVGADRALESSSQVLSLLPGLWGGYLRNAFLRRALAECHPTARVEFGTLFSKAGARLGAYSYIGPRCCIGLAHIERDVLIAAGVHIPSGGQLHAIDDPTRPIREQTGVTHVVHIGQGSWIGANAVVMADVGRHSVIGAGAVVTRPIPDHVIAVGVPARVVRSRLADGKTNSVDERELATVPAEWR